MEYRIHTLVESVILDLKNIVLESSMQSQLQILPFSISMSIRMGFQVFSFDVPELRD